MALSLNILSLEPCDLERTGHQPKMFLFMLDEMMYACQGLGDNYDGQQVITFEILSLAPHWYSQCKWV